MRKLARLSGLSVTAIQKIENDKMVPTVVVIYKIARALNKKMSTFLGEDDANGNRIHIPARSRKKIIGSLSNSIIEMISGASEDWIIQAAEHTIAPGGKSGTESFSHRGEELVICLQGRIKFFIDTQTYVLRKNDRRIL